MATSFVVNKPLQALINLMQKEWLKQTPTIQRLKIAPLPIFRFLTLTQYKIQVEPVNFFPINSERIRDFYNGIFAFGDKAVTCTNVSPFQIEPPSLYFEQELQSFAWLSDLSAAKNKIANQFAINMTQSWLENCKYQANATAWQPEIVARRFISFLANCKLLLNNNNPVFTKKFYKSLNFQYHFLYLSSRILINNEDKLLAYTALYFASLSLNLCDKHKNHIEKEFANCLKQQIFADGGHISRNPHNMVNLLLHLLALRYSFNYVGKPIINELHNAIERMIPAFKMFIHKDGSIARFNGVGTISNEKINTILTLDKTKAETFNYAPHSGYQRLEAENTVLISDVGSIGKPIYSNKATASCLAFELSSGKHSFIVNSGIDHFDKANNNFLGRSTTAHSTASINDNSSYNFIELNDKAKNILIKNKIKVEIEQIKGPQYNGFIARHNGYQNLYDIIYERKIMLSHDGNSIHGADNFITLNNNSCKLKGSDQANIRFHIHPDIEVRYNSSEQIFLQAPQGDLWCFNSSHITPQIEDSIFLADSHQARPNKQIVLRLCPSIYPKINWFLEKI